MIRKLLLALLVLLVIAVVVVDRVGGSVASHVLAGKLESDEHLDSRPSVSIGGFPFLTQAISGDYNDVTVTTHGFLTPDRVRIDTLTAKLHGVHIPLSKVVGGSVKTVPVDRVDGSVFVSFGDVANYLATRGITVALTRSSANAVNVVGRLAAHAKLVQGLATIGVSGTTVTLSIAATSGLPRALVLRIPIQGLPFRFTVTSVQVGVGGISGTGTARHVVLGS